MRKRKPDTCQSGQAKIFKFFKRTIDIPGDGKLSNKISENISPVKVTSASSTLLSVKEVVNQDNIQSSKDEQPAICKYRAEQPEIILDSKENSTFVGNDNCHEVKSIISETKKICIVETVDPKNHNNQICQFTDGEKGNFEDFFDEWDLCADDSSMENKIEDMQLDSLKRCKVVSITDGPGNFEKTLVLSSTETKQLAKCILRGVWSASAKIVSGDVINIRCNSQIKENGYWILGGETQSSHGKDMDLLVEHPDLLISGTSVVGSLFCPRKSVLADRFRGFEAASFPEVLCNDPSIGSDASSFEVQQADKKLHNPARIMLIGSIVHELLQTSLSGKLYEPTEINKAAYDILHSRRLAIDMYAAQMELYDVKKEVLNFVPSISRFMKNFVDGGSTPTESSDIWGKGENKDNASEWKGSISTIKDIEENLWVPTLGLKGKIDVTVEVKIHPRQPRDKLTKRNVKEMPLELKTGRSTYSPEHQGQVLLYCLMKSSLAAENNRDYETINSGILLYLREESIREISAGKCEMRDLIMLRNELSHYLTQGPILSNEEELLNLLNGKKHNVNNPSSKISMALPVLPEPINHKRACSKCPYLTLCSAHLKCDSSLDTISKNHPMSLLGSQALRHLRPSHLDYFVHWSCLVSLEYQETSKESKAHVLWTLKPPEREKMGRCLSDLIVTEVKCVTGKDLELSEKVFIEGHIHNMVRKDTSKSSLSTLTYNVGEWVLISSDKRVSLSSGTVVSLTPDMLCLCLDRDITSRFGKGPFHVDKYDFMSTSSAFCLTSLGLLLEDNWSASRLRELIIDKREPQFLKKLDGKVLSRCSSILKKLNKTQMRAILRALSAQDYLCIRGLPGTGKTATIVGMIQTFVALGKSVLLTGHSHSSVDNVMLRLVEEGLGESILRLGKGTAQIHVDLKQYTESLLTENCLSPQDLDKVYHSKMIVGVTCMGSGHPLLCHRAFDVCIVDEAGQVLLPVSLRPIMSARVFVLVGDTQQLPPVVRGNRARILGLEETMLSTLDYSEANVTLNLQYRMNKMITKLANDLTYGTSLTCANDEVANAVVNIPKLKDLHDQYHEDKWLHAMISDDINYSVMFINAGNTHDLINEDFYIKAVKSNQLDIPSNENMCKYMNFSEAALAYYIVKALLLGGAKEHEIAVIAPYKDQVGLLKNVLKDQFVEINTVDQFQGRDKAIVLYSFTRSGKPVLEDTQSKDLQLLSDKHRLTVAITRAKQKLICIGDVETLKTYRILNRFISLVPENNFVNVSDKNNGFNWIRIFSSLIA